VIRSETPIRVEIGHQNKAKNSNVLARKFVNFHCLISTVLGDFINNNCYDKIVDATKLGTYRLSVRRFEKIF